MLYKRDLIKPEVSEFSGETKLINDMFVVDSEYYEWLSGYRWNLGTTGYAVTTIGKSGKCLNLKMHRLIMGAVSGQLVDHINRNKLDNRLSNLRFSNKSENALNTVTSDNAKLYTYDKNRDKWMVLRTGKHYGRFDTEEEAQAVAEIVRAGGTYKKPVIKPTHCRHGHELDASYFQSKPKRCQVCRIKNGRERSLRYYYRMKNQALPIGDRD